MLHDCISATHSVEILTPDAGDWSTTFRQNSFFVLQSRKFPEIAYGEIVKKM